MKNIILLTTAILLLTGCAGFTSKRKFNSSDTALLIIDVQNAYLPVYNQGAFIQNINLLEDRAREAEVPIIFIRNIDGYNEEGSRGWKFQGSLRPQENDYVVEKRFPSSFSDTELKELLDRLEIKTLVLTGLASTGCYGATVTDARLKKYNTVVVSDAHGDHAKGRAEYLNKSLADKENVLLTEAVNIFFVNK